MGVVHTSYSYVICQMNINSFIYCCTLASVTLIHRQQCEYIQSNLVNFPLDYREWIFSGCNAHYTLNAWICIDSNSKTNFQWHKKFEIALNVNFYGFYRPLLSTNLKYMRKFLFTPFVYIIDGLWRSLSNKIFLFHCQVYE